MLQNKLNKKMQSSTVDIMYIPRHNNVIYNIHNSVFSNKFNGMTHSVITRQCAYTYTFRPF